MRFQVCLSLWSVTSWLCIDTIPEVAKTKVSKPKRYSLSKLRLCHAPLKRLIQTHPHMSTSRCGYICIIQPKCSRKERRRGFSNAVVLMQRVREKLCFYTTAKALDLAFRKKMHLGIIKITIFDHFVNLGEDVILTLLWQSGASESSTVCFVISLSICYWQLKCRVSCVMCVEGERETGSHHRRVSGLNWGLSLFFIYVPNKNKIHGFGMKWNECESGA